MGDGLCVVCDQSCFSEVVVEELLYQQFFGCIIEVGLLNMVFVVNGVVKQNGYSQSWKVVLEKLVVKKMDLIYNSDVFWLWYEVYSWFQVSVVVFGEKLFIFEIVVVGGQLDGKSFLLEVFLGFCFNIWEVEMGIC